MTRIQRGFSSFLFPGISFFLWWLITSLHLIPLIFLPTPKEVVEALHDAEPTLAGNAFATLLRLIAGFGSGLFLGYAVGLLMILFRPVRIAIGPVVDNGRAAPSVATLPFFLLWFGFALYGQVLFIALGVAVIVGSAVVDAGRAISPHLIHAAQTFRATRWQLARTVIIPGLLPQLAPTLRISLGVAGSLTVASEFMGADNGIGVLLDLSRRTLRTENLVLFTFVLSLLVMACDIVLRAFIAYYLRWMPKSTEALDRIVPMSLRKGRDKGYD